MIVCDWGESRTLFIFPDFIGRERRNVGRWMIFRPRVEIFFLDAFLWGCFPDSSGHFLRAWGSSFSVVTFYVPGMIPSKEWNFILNIFWLKENYIYTQLIIFSIHLNSYINSKTLILLINLFINFQYILKYYRHYSLSQVSSSFFFSQFLFLFYSQQ